MHIIQLHIADCFFPNIHHTLTTIVHHTLSTAPHTSGESPGKKRVRLRFCTIKKVILGRYPGSSDWKALIMDDTADVCGL